MICALGGADWRLSKGNGVEGITTRHAASLRPSENGRIGSKSRYSQRETTTKAPYGFNLLYRGLSPSWG